MVGYKILKYLPRIELAFHGGRLKIDSMYFGPNELNPMVPNKVKEFAATIMQYTLHFNNLLKTVGNSEGIRKLNDNENIMR